MAEPRIAGYKVLQPIGRGGQATVYLAERAADGLAVALKVLDRAAQRDRVYLDRLRREYRVLAAIHHPYVARIYDHGFGGMLPYIAMEFVPSGTLAGRMHGGMDAAQAQRLAGQIAHALDAIHARGIVHRDLKPANILLRPDATPVIVDFGLSKDLAANSTLTIAGQFLATPRYMSPEQCQGLEVDGRSDLYSLGVIFYEMLTGLRMYETADPAQLVNLQVNGPLPALPESLGAYQPVLDRLLAKQPQDRAQTARELLALLGA
jgi:serine/threonine-protein kinase PpkA